MWLGVGISFGMKEYCVCGGEGAEIDDGGDAHGAEVWLGSQRSSRQRRLALYHLPVATCMRPDSGFVLEVGHRESLRPNTWAAVGRGI